MKYYLAFILISDKDRSDVKGFSSFQNPFKWEYDKESDTWFSLYAWTTEKKLMKKFKKQRSEKYFKYKVIENNLDEKDLDTGLKLEKRLYVSGNKGEEEMIISTSFEYQVSTDEGLLAEIFLETTNLPDPLLLSKELLTYIERFGYSYIFYSYTTNGLPFDEDDYDNSFNQYIRDRYDLFWDNYSYRDLSRGGRYINEKSIPGQSVIMNEFNSFICLFDKLFI